MGKIKPYPFQKEGVRIMEAHNGRNLLADETGLGKTFQALMYMVRNKRYPTVVVCPAIAKYTWEAEIAKCISKRAIVLNGRKPAPFSRFHNVEIVVINYDILHHWIDILKGLKPQLVVIDECQHLTNPRTLRTTTVRKLCKGVPHIQALSATPLVNRPIEMYPVLKLLWPKEFPSRIAYGNRYCKPRWEYGRMVFKGAQRLPELNARLLGQGMIRRKKRDVLKDLPPITRSIVLLPLDDPNNEYGEAKRDFLGWLGKNYKGKARRAAKAEALVKVGYLKRLAAKLKFKYVKQWLDEFGQANPNEKLIIFAWHKACIKALCQHFPNQHVMVDGSLPAKKRFEAVQAFQSNKRITRFIGNLQAAGTNVTLTAASNVAMVELDYRPGIMIQGEGRSDRIGQVNPVTAHYLIGMGTIEVPICNIIQKKQSNITTVLDGEGTGLEYDIFDLLIENIHKGT